jgi:hypothetical protein
MRDTQTFLRYLMKINKIDNKKEDLFMNVYKLFASTNAQEAIPAMCGLGIKSKYYDYLMIQRKIKYPGFYTYEQLKSLHLTNYNIK